MSGAMMSEEVSSPQQVVIRRAEATDAQAVYELVVALAEARDAMDKMVSSVEDIVRDGFAADPAFEALIAEVGGKAVGLCLYFGSYSTWRGQRGIYVQDLIVTDRARGLGVGTACWRRWRNSPRHGAAATCGFPSRPITPGRSPSTGAAASGTPRRS